MIIFVFHVTNPTIWKIKMWVNIKSLQMFMSFYQFKLLIEVIIVYPNIWCNYICKLCCMKTDLVHSLTVIVIVTIPSGRTPIINSVSELVVRKIAFRRITLHQLIEWGKCDIRKNSRTLPRFHQVLFIFENFIFFHRTIKIKVPRDTNCLPLHKHCVLQIDKHRCSDVKQSCDQIRPTWSMVGDNPLALGETLIGDFVCDSFSLA